MERTQIKNGNTFHDYRTDMLGWGWNILNFEKKDSFKAQVMGIGKGIENGHIVVLSQNNEHGNIAFEVNKIDYDTNPPDLYTAELVSIGYVD